MKIRAIVLALTLCVVILVPTLAFAASPSTLKTNLQSKFLLRYYEPACIKVYLTGTVLKSDIEGKHLELVTAKGTRYTLTGNISELWKYVGKQVSITGVIRNCCSIYMRGQTLEVYKFTPVTTEPRLRLYSK